tara:strand:+ start:162 stop:599 length:438 start_codon:yes stop_codon:yes gene_type:complete
MEKYYVYKHTDRGKVVYIGMGTKDRAWVVHKRSDQHKRFMIQLFHNDILSIKVLKYFDNKKDALKYERQLINKYKPKFNKTWKISAFWTGKKQSEETKYKRMLSDPRRVSINYMGKKYNSIRECSRLTKIPCTTLRDRLKNSVRS